jgi:hypothetical protein
MAQDNLPAPAGPVATTPPTQESLVEDISNLLDDPAPDPIKEPEEPAAAAAEDDDPLGLAEDVETHDEPDDPEDDGPDAEIKGGRFAPDSAKLKLDNGETITVRDLKDRVDKRVKEFQRGFTEKTQAAAAREAEVNQYAQSLDQFREYATWYAEQHLPKQPGPPPDPSIDPQGFLVWQHQRDEYQTHVQAFQAFQQQQQQDVQRKAGETQKQANERLARERTALFEAIPVFKDAVKGKQVWDAIVTGANQHYGIAPEEVNSTADHRFIKVLRDALAYRRIKDAAPKVQAEVARKPAVRDGRRAPSNQQVKAKQERLERLKRDPSLANGAASLMDFDL